ncbi:methylaspartate ammonia-lyase, partial [Klebsiella pneumoniae]|nr:methylaspartate ammonia-lyase [Klebsiella pneumoniae]MCP6663622.1 methylaspartate ammonia-lyase [Klebsiella pneumoniae]
MAFKNDVDRIVEYFRQLEKAAAPLHLRIEGPVDVEEREQQIKVLAEITSRLHKENIKVEIVADEWCNT